MTLLHADFPSGADGLYGTTASYMLDGRYAEVTERVTLVEDPDPNVTGNVLRLELFQAIVPTIRYILPAVAQTVGMAARVWLSFIPADVLERPVIFTWRNALNQNLGYLLANTAGGITFVEADGTETAATTGPVLSANGWYHIEAKFDYDGTTGNGTVSVRVEGTEVLSTAFTNVQATYPTDCAQVAMSAGGTNFSDILIYYKDFVVWNTSGTVNNNFFGSVSVRALLPASDVSLNWTPSTGTTGFDLIDESPPVDSDYIAAPDPAPAAAVMSLTDLPTDVTSVRGLITVARARKSDGGDGSLQVGLVSNGDVGNGADRSITSAYLYWADVFELDPDNASAWTPSSVNAADIRFDRTV